MERCTACTHSVPPLVAHQLRQVFSSTFSANAGGANGGAVAAGRGTAITVSHSHITGSVAGVTAVSPGGLGAAVTAAGTCSVTASGGKGGALWVSSLADATIEATEVTSNNATRGERVLVSHPPTPASGSR